MWGFSFVGILGCCIIFVMFIVYLWFPIKSTNEEKKLELEKEYYNVGIIGLYSLEFSNGISSMYNKDSRYEVDKDNSITFYEYDSQNRHYSILALPDDSSKFYGVFNSFRSINCIIINIESDGNDNIPYIEDKCYLAKVTGVLPIIFNVLHPSDNFDSSFWETNLKLMAERFEIDKENIYIINSVLESNLDSIKIKEESLIALASQLDLINLRKIACNSKEFFMTIDDVYNVVSQSNVVTGVISSGELKKGDTIELLGNGIRKKIVVKKIEGYLAEYDVAYPGYHVGVHFDEISDVKFVKGMVLAALEAYELKSGFLCELKVMEGSDINKSFELQTGKTYKIFANSIESTAKLDVENDIIWSGQKGFATFILENSMTIPENTPVVVCDKYDIAAVGHVI